MIYFIREVGGLGLVKIGTTKQLTVRLKTLQRENGTPFEVLGVTVGALKEERALHKRFSHLQHQSRRKREYFRADPELLLFIQEASVAWDGRDEVPIRQTPTALTVKGWPEWRDWMQRGAKHCGTDVSSLVAAALAEYALDQGFAEPPPRR